MMYDWQYRNALPIAVMRAGGRVEISRDQLSNPPDLIISIDQDKNVWVLEAHWLEAELMPADPALPAPEKQRLAAPPKAIPAPAAPPDYHDVEPEPVPAPIEPPSYLEKRAVPVPEQPFVSFGYVMRWGSHSIAVSGYKSPDLACQECLDLALRSGWTPRKFWQFWRWNDISQPTVSRRP